ncbi:MAG: toxic anion resistance protein [Lachnospiraceae bacterium]|nr:toxic anion resistance protein [Lachnospiraceae bacterium]
MDKDLQEFSVNATPTLTFEPFKDDVQTEAEAEVSAALSEIEANAAVPAQQIFDESTLTTEEREMIATFASQIELNNSSLIMQYGAGAQKKIADFSGTALDKVQTKDLGEVGNMLSSVVTELKSFDVDDEPKGLLSFFKKTANKVTALQAKYDKAENNVAKISTALEDAQITLLKDVAMLDKMYDLNLTYFKELSMYILAGKKRLEKAQNEELPALIEKSKASGLPEDAQAANDFANLINRFEKKVHDLELTRAISLQMAPQIRLVQSNDTLMAEKIQSTLVNTIPLWKSQMVLALGVSHSAQAAEAQQEVTNMTNELLKKNAATLKMATIETAKETERGIVDIETLKTTNQALISTFDEVIKIQSDGRKKRAEAELELRKIENELKNKLLEVRN